MATVLVTSEPAVVDVQVGTAEEANEWARRVEDVREAWIARSGKGFYTLGAASYIDVHSSDDPERDYYGRIGATNPVIWRQLGDVLERVRRTLETMLGAPARYEPSLALPGVHIFEPEGIATGSNGSAHFDFQYHRLRFPALADEERVVSFTLSLRLPAEGGGLDTWNVFPSDISRYERLGRTIDFAQITRTKPSTRHVYTVGVMAVQVRPILHRIGPIRSVTADDQRMTLQGHGIRDASGWLLYW